MEVKTTAVIGAGAMGRSIAYVATLGGYKTILEDISGTTLENAIAWIRQKLDAEFNRREVAAEIRDTALASLSTAGTVEDAIREADLIIETAADEMEVKIELFTILDKFAKPNAIFASTSSELSVTEMAAVTFCAGRCIGMRFADGDPQSERLNLVRGLETSHETVAVCREVGRRLGKDVVVVRELDPGVREPPQHKSANIES
jgi:3-hydroxybutyryl-CoA dehydrogenase